MDIERAKLMYPYADRPQIILEDGGACRWCTFSLLREQGLSKGQIGDAIRSISRSVNTPPGSSRGYIRDEDVDAYQSRVLEDRRVTITAVDESGGGVIAGFSFEREPMTCGCS